MAARQTGSNFMLIESDLLRSEVSRIFPVLPTVVDGNYGVMVLNGDVEVVKGYLENPKGFDENGYKVKVGLTRDRRRHTMPGGTPFAVSIEEPLTVVVENQEPQSDQRDYNTEVPNLRGQ